MHDLAFAFGWITCSGEVDTGGHNVYQVGRLRADRGRFDVTRPTHDERGRDSALVHPVLVHPEWRVRGIGPGNTVALIRLFGAGMDRGQVSSHDRFTVSGGLWNVQTARFRSENLGAASVIGEEHDDGVPVLP